MLGILFLALLLSAKVSFGQSTIFSESMGTVGGNTLIAAHETANGFQNVALTMVGVNTGGNVDVRTSNASSAAPTYSTPTPSGLGNVFFALLNTGSFAIEGINASASTSLLLSFGIRKESATLAIPLTLEYWNGTAFVAVTLTGMPAANAATGWYYISNIAIPAAAQINGTRLRWVKTLNTSSFRLDDVLFRGTLSTPVINTSPTSLVKFVTTAGVASEEQKITVSGTNLTANIVLPTIANYEYTLSSGSGYVNNLSFTPSAGSVGATDVFIRMKSGLALGTYNPTLTITSTGAPNVVYNILGQAYPVLGAFTPGNLAVARIGTGDAVLTSDATPVFISEVTKTGTIVQTGILPVSVNGANRRYSVVGSSTTSALSNLTPNRKYLMLAGNTSKVGTPIGTANSVSLNPKVIARIAFDGTVNTSTTLTDGFDGDNIRSATSLDGTQFWAAGQGAVAGTYGVRTVAFGASTSTALTGGSENTRYVQISNSQLYVASNSAANGSVLGISTVGSGLPTSGTNTITQIPGTSSDFIANSSF